MSFHLFKKPKTKKNLLFFNGLLYICISHLGYEDLKCLPVHPPFAALLTPFLVSPDHFGVMNQEQQSCWFEIQQINN